jgi:helix-turn-helix protein
VTHETVAGGIATPYGRFDGGVAIGGRRIGGRSEVPVDQRSEHRSRRLWRALEPVHAVVYFAPEPQAACTALGTHGYWMSYFALRAAPLGAAPPELVAALFYGFAPRLVHRAVPDIWRVAAPERYLAVRLEAVNAALSRLLGADVVGSAAVAEAAELAREAALAAPTAGRPLGAANASLPWPELPHLVLWHAQTVLREQRGDGHVASLLTAGLDPVESGVLFAADIAMDQQWMRTRRGWTEDEWAAGGRRLVDRGLLTPEGALTAEGTSLRAHVEARTDALADAAWATLGDRRATRLAELVTPLVRAIVAGDSFLRDNPMGLRPLVAVPQP